MIDRYRRGTQAEWQHNVVQQAIAGVAAVLRERNVSHVSMRLSTTEGSLLVHL